MVENSYATISRFILLDSMLLFFTATTMFSLVKFHSYRKQEFSPWWWVWLATTGVSIGCVCSVKWVGMFGMAVVGLYTIEDLWNKFGDQKMIAVHSASNSSDISASISATGLLVYYASSSCRSWSTCSHSGYTS